MGAKLLPVDTAREGEMRVGGALESVPRATSVALSPCNGVDHEMGVLPRLSP